MLLCPPKINISIVFTACTSDQRFALPLGGGRDAQQRGDGGGQVLDVDALQGRAGSKAGRLDKYGDGHILGHKGAVGAVMSAVVCCHNNRVLVTYFFEYFFDIANCIIDTLQIRC